jgi:hypothetical protein
LLERFEHFLLGTLVGLQICSLTFRRYPISSSLIGLILVVTANKATSAVCLIVKGYVGLSGTGSAELLPVHYIKLAPPGGHEAAVFANVHFR